MRQFKRILIEISSFKQTINFYRMKYFIPTCLALAVGLFSCNSSDEESDSDTTETDSVATEVLENENFLSVEKWDSTAWDFNGSKEYYIISYAGLADEAEAIAMVDSLKPDYPNAGYLWIPDFASLSGKELYAIFLDQSAYKFSIMESYQKQKKANKGTYLVRVNQSEERWEAYSPIDIRINGERQKMILTYSTPEDEESYAEEGGEDWGWFVNDVSTYFADNHPEIIFGSVYGDGLLDEEIESIESEMELEGAGFGYIFMDGKEKGWAGHDMPEGVISQACEFFGFDYNGPEY